MKNFSDGISKADIEIRPHQLLSTVCFLGGAECPLSEKDMIVNILKQVGNDPALRIKVLCS